MNEESTMNGEIDMLEEGIEASVQQVAVDAWVARQAMEDLHLAASEGNATLRTMALPPKVRAKLHERNLRLLAKRKARKRHTKLAKTGKR